MYILSIQEMNSEVHSDDNCFIDIDEIMGDIDSCMQSPECTDQTTPPFEG